jgi:hypothetical protein
MVLDDLDTKYVREDKLLTSCNASLGWTAKDADMCFYVPIERWTWREGLGSKLHNLSQVGVSFKFQWKENSTKILAGPYQNILNALFQVQPNFSSPVNKKIVWFLLISLGGQP